VTITGTNFKTGASVFIGANPATVTSVTATEIRATTPAGAGPQDVIVTNTDALSATLVKGFTYLGNPPTITSVSPNSAITRHSGTFSANLPRYARAIRSLTAFDVIDN